MLKRKDLVRTVEYWMETIQNELFRHLREYMKGEKMNKTELAKKLNVSKGYISQILGADSNFTLKKLIELSLTAGKVPYINFITPDKYLEIETERINYSDKAKLAHSMSFLVQKHPITSTAIIQTLST